jgi:hypothetical protein
MANRSDVDRAGRGVRALVELGQEGDGAGGSTEVSSGSAWEQMLEALTSEDEAGPHNDGALRASIAERLHTRGGPASDPGEAPDVRPVRRRRR